MGSWLPVVLLMPMTEHVLSSLKVTHSSFSVVDNSLAFRGLNLQNTRTLPVMTSFVADGAFKNDLNSVGAAGLCPLAYLANAGLSPVDGASIDSGGPWF